MIKPIGNEMVANYTTIMENPKKKPVTIDSVLKKSAKAQRPDINLEVKLKNLALRDSIKTPRGQSMRIIPEPIRKNPSDVSQAQLNNIISGIPRDSAVNIQRDMINDGIAANMRKYMGVSDNLVSAVAAVFSYKGIDGMPDIEEFRDKDYQILRKVFRDLDQGSFRIDLEKLFCVTYQSKTFRKGINVRVVSYEELLRYTSGSGDYLKNLRSLYLSKGKEILVRKAPRPTAIIALSHEFFHMGCDLLKGKGVLSRDEALEECLAIAFQNMVHAQLRSAELRRDEGYIRLGAYGFVDLDIRNIETTEDYMRPETRSAR